MRILVDSSVMNLETALQAHAEWKIKFRAAISGKQTLDAAQIGRDDCCPLGKWLHGDGRREHGRLPEFASALSKHKEFHVAAGNVAVLINGQKFAEAERALNAGAFPSASTAIGGAIVALKKRTQP